VIADQTIALDCARTNQDYPEHLRRIRFKDPETGKTLVFLTNQTSLPALLRKQSKVCHLFRRCALNPTSFFKSTQISDLPS
jgi:hypothetical protein